MSRSWTMLALVLAVEPATAPQADVLNRMAAVNSDLHSFSATLRAHVTMKSFPFLSADLVGTYYYKEPDKTKVVFNSGVPLVASQFNKLYAHIESPSRWREVYNVTLLSDDGITSKFRLVPRKHGNVDRIEVAADDKAATVTSMRWEYGNGGYAEMINRYTRIGNDLVVESQKGHVEEPGYVADLNSTIDDYRINPSLPDSLFVDR
ncbi:MAG: hypothetical protein JO078_00140 [Candidatus Eremiobacteraeota bacterium]|nr:hypothetical protein [Candidatus Eremiobacteraeota bacterium]